jgi:uridine phosphorylase
VHLLQRPLVIAVRATYFMDRNWMPLMFYSPEPTGRIEPSDFISYVLSRRGLEAQGLGLRNTVLLTFIPELERRLLKRLGSPVPHAQLIQRQSWYNPDGHAFSTMISPMGAPMAVMLLEQLIAIGARRFLYLGFCGALDPGYQIGDCFVPTTGVREEGTSYHYLPAHVAPAASPQANTLLHAQAATQGIMVHSGAIWTTDAPYRETASKISRFQEAGIRAVDMEMTALFAVAQYRACDVGALLVVSDECYHPTWQPGFGQQRMRQGCQDAVDLCIHAADRLAAVS